jgi:hypothetical protein
MFKRNTAGSRMPNVQNAGNVRQSNNSISLATSRLLHDRSPQYHQHWPGRSQHHHRQAARACRSGSLQPLQLPHPPTLLELNPKAQTGCPIATMEQPTRGKKTFSSQQCFEKALHRYCLWHPNGMHSAFACHNLQRALGVPPLKNVRKKDHEERRQDYSNDNLSKN